MLKITVDIASCWTFMCYVCLKLKMIIFIISKSQAVIHFIFLTKRLVLISEGMVQPARSVSAGFWLYVVFLFLMDDLI